MKLDRTLAIAVTLCWLSPLLAAPPLPEGAIARLGSLDQRTGGEPLQAAVAFAADGKTFVTVSAGKHVRVWDAATGQLRESRTLSGPITSRSNGLSTNGRWLASMTDDEFMIQDIAADREQCRVRIGPRSSWHPACFSPDGQFAVAYFSDRSSDDFDPVPGVYRIERTTGRLTRTEAPPHTTHDLTVSPDGKRFFGCEQGGCVFGCDATTGKLLWRVKSPGEWFVVTPNGKELLVRSHSGSPTKLQRLDAATGEQLVNEGLPSLTGSGSLLISRDGKLLASHEGDSIRLWDLLTGKVRGEIGPMSGTAALSPDGKLLITAGAVVRRWDTATGRPLDPDPTATCLTLPIMQLGVSPDGQLIVAADSEIVHAWEAITGRPLWRRRRPYTSLGERIRFLPDSSALALGDAVDDRNVVRLLEPLTGRELQRIEVDKAGPNGESMTLLDVFVSPDSKRLWTVSTARLADPPQSQPRSFREWDLATGQSRQHDLPPGRVFLPALGPARWGGTHELLDGDGDVIRPLPTLQQFVAGGRLVAGTLGYRDQQQKFVVAEVATGRVVVREDASSDQSCLSPDGRFLALATTDALIVREIMTGRVTHRFATPGPMRGMSQPAFASRLAWHPRNRFVATALPDTTTLVWDTSSLGQPRERLSAGDLASCWHDLASEDALTAWRAVTRLAGDPQWARPYLRERLGGEAEVPTERLRDLIDGLDAKSFREREGAQRELAGLVSANEATLRARLAGDKLSDEQRRRLTRAIEAGVRIVPTPAALRRMRALAALEQMGE